MKSINGCIENCNEKKILKKYYDSEKSREFGRIRKVGKQSGKLRKFGNFPTNSDDLATLAKQEQKNEYRVVIDRQEERKGKYIERQNERKKYTYNRTKEIKQK